MPSRSTLCLSAALACALVSLATPRAPAQDAKADPAKPLKERVRELEEQVARQRDEIAELRAALERLGALRAKRAERRAPPAKQKPPAAKKDPEKPAPEQPKPLVITSQAERHLYSAGEKLAQGKRAGALADLKAAELLGGQALDKKPMVWWVRARLAETAPGPDPQAAFKYYSHAIKLDFQHFPSHLSRAWIFLARGEHEQALDAVDFVSESDAAKPGSALVPLADVEEIRGRCASATKDWEGALAAWKALAQICPRERAAKLKLPERIKAAAKALDEARSKGPYAQRFDRSATLAREGGSPATEKAVVTALEWLERTQSPNGLWDCDDWKGIAKHPKDGQNAGDSRYDVGVTGLALLAFAAHGNTHRSGPFKEPVARALRRLMVLQKRDGRLGIDGDFYGEQIYNHAIATAALCELAGLSGDPRVLASARKAVGFALKAQNPGLGWQYGVRPGRNDTSVTGWFVVALDAARAAGIKVPDEAFAGARAWFRRATSSAGEVGYTSPGGGSSYLPQNDGKYDELPVMTAVGVCGRVLCGDSAKDPVLLKGLAVLARNQPSRSDKGRSFYYWYYGAHALFQAGGQSWKDWSAALVRTLVPSQLTQGIGKGSWPPSGEWCLAGGRVYATALNALTLQTYYRSKRRPAADPRQEGKPRERPDRNPRRRGLPPRRPR